MPPKEVRPNIKETGIPAESSVQRIFSGIEVHDMGIESMKAVRSLDLATAGLNANLKKASTGRKINSAADDAAGLAIMNALEAGAVQLNQGTRNAADAQSAINIAQGAYNSLGTIQTRQAELAAQAANGTYSDAQKASMNEEAQALSQEAQRITETTKFNGVNVMSTTMIAQVGTDSSSNSQIAVATQTPSAPSIDLTSAAGARAALDTMNTAISSSAQAQGTLGAAYSRLQTAMSNNRVAAENMTAAADRIGSADMAETGAEIARNTTLQKTSLASLGESMKAERIKITMLNRKS